LRKQTMETHGMEVTLLRATALPPEMITSIKQGFAKIYQPGVLYRATGIVLSQLHAQGGIQTNIFESSQRIEKWRRVYGAIDQMNAKQGQHMIHLAETHRLIFPWAKSP